MTTPNSPSIGALKSSAALDDLVLTETATIRDGMVAIDRSGLEVALICSSERHLLGMVTDGDIRRALLREFDLDASIMVAANTQITSVRPDLHRSAVVQLLLAKGFKCVPVVDEDGKLIDMHTLFDVLLGQEVACTAVLMAGGKGTRLGALTEAIPKPMLPVGDRPILERIVQLLVSHGIRRIYISINHMGDMIVDHFKDGTRFYCDIDYLRETEPLGTAGALRLLPARPEEPLLVMNGDLLTNVHLTRRLALHHENRNHLTMALRRHVIQVPFGVAHTEDGRVTSIVEKPELKYDINAGIYVLNPACIDLIPSSGPCPMTTLVQSCLDEQLRVGGYALHESWKDIGVPAEFESAQQYRE